MPEEQIKFKVITGKGEEKELGVETKKEVRVPFKQISSKTEIEKGEESEKEKERKKQPKIKRRFKLNKKQIKLLLIIFFILLFVLSSYLFYQNWSLVSKKFQFLTYLLEKKEGVEELLQPTSSEALKLLIQKLKTPQKEIETATSSQGGSAVSTTATPTQNQPTSTPTTTKIQTTTIITATPTVSPTPTNLIATGTLTSQTLPKEKTINDIEPPSPKPEAIKRVNTEEIPLQKTKDVVLTTNLNFININLKELNEEGLKKAWVDSLKIQKEAGSIYEINFLYNNSKVISEIVRNYFIKPSFIEQEHSDEFKKLLNDYKVLFYYTHSRKYPVLIFKVSNNSFTTTFMRLWDKESLLKDMYNLYLGLPKGNLIRKFTITEEYSGVKYKIAYYDNDYKLIWTVYNNYLIISTSLNAFKYIINLLK